MCEFSKKKRGHRKLEGRHYIDFPFCARSFFEIHYKVIRAPTNLSKGKLFTKPSFPCQDRLINFPVHFAVISLRRCPLRVDESLPFFHFSLFFALSLLKSVGTCSYVSNDHRWYRRKSDRSDSDRKGEEIWWRIRETVEISWPEMLVGR